MLVVETVGAVGSGGAAMREGEGEGEGEGGQLYIVN